MCVTTYVQNQQPPAAQHIPTDFIVLNKARKYCLLRIWSVGVLVLEIKKDNIEDLSVDSIDLGPNVRWTVLTWDLMLGWQY